MARPMSCRIGLRSRPSIGAGSSRANGFDVVRMNSRKAAPIQPCTASTLARSVAGRLRAEDRDQRAEEGQDQHPQQHRAFVVAPGAGDLVRASASANGNSPRHWRPRNPTGHRPSSAPRRRQRVSAKPVTATGPPTAIMPLVAGARADQRHGRLDQRQREGQHQREMAEPQPLRARLLNCACGCQTPFAFRLSATSFGM